MGLTALTVTELKAETLALGGHEIEDMTNNEFLRYLRRALVNKRHELAYVTQGMYDSGGSGTINSDKRTITLPADWDQESHLTVYSDSSYDNIIDSRLVMVQDGTIRFSSDQDVGTTYYYRYRKTMTLPTDMNDTVSETTSLRAREYLQDEVTSLYLQKEEDLEMSQASANQLSNADRIS